MISGIKQLGGMNTLKPQIILILISVLLGASGQICIKWGTNTISNVSNFSILGMTIKYLTSSQILIGLVLYALSAILWIFALAHNDLSYAYPMVALGYVVVVIVSYFLFNETITYLRLLGLAVIVVGVIIIAYS